MKDLSENLTGGETQMRNFMSSPSFLHEGPCRVNFGPHRDMVDCSSCVRMHSTHPRPSREQLRSFTINIKVYLGATLRGLIDGMLATEGPAQDTNRS